MVTEFFMYYNTVVIKITIKQFGQILKILKSHIVAGQCHPQVQAHAGFFSRKVFTDFFFIIAYFLISIICTGKTANFKF